MGLSAELLIATIGFALLVAGALVFWWMDRRSERVQMHEPQDDILARLPDGVLVLRCVRSTTGAITDFTCTRLNKEGERILGIRAVDLIGRSLIHSLPGSHAAEHFPALVAFMDLGTRPAELVSFGSGAKHRWAERRVVRSADGLLLVIRDISDRIRAQRTERMVACLATAEACSRVAAHDIRNPLTNLSLVEDQLRVELDFRSDTLPFLDMLRRNIDRVRQVTDEMVAIAAPVKVNLRPMDLRALLRTALEAIGQKAEARGISIDVAFPVELPLVLADSAALDIVLQHSLSMYVDLLPTGTGVMDLHLRWRGQDVELVFGLSGERIDPDAGSRLMRYAFQRLSAAERAVYGHVHGILLAHGAVMEADVIRANRIEVRIAFQAAAPDQSPVNPVG